MRSQKELDRKIETSSMIELGKFEKEKNSRSSSSIRIALTTRTVPGRWKGYVGKGEKKRKKGKQGEGKKKEEKKDAED